MQITHFRRSAVKKRGQEDVIFMFTKLFLSMHFYSKANHLPSLYSEILYYFNKNAVFC